MCFIQAPYLTPEWNRTSHAQTVFYTEHKCIPLHSMCLFNFYNCCNLKFKCTLHHFIPYFIGLSRDMEELLVEGLLLQVSVPEVQSLYHVILDQANSQHSDRCMSPSQGDSTNCDKHAQYTSQENRLPSHQVQTLVHK